MHSGKPVITKIQYFSVAAKKVQSTAAMILQIKSFINADTEQNKDKN